MTLWFVEEDENNLQFGYGLKKTLFSGKSEYQDILVVDTKTYGKMLVIDDCVMVTEKDEFVYHEMIAHIPALLHPKPKKVLVIGGGDGGTVRELLRHPSVEQVVLAELDQMVIDVCKEYLPQTAACLEDSRVQLEVGDGVAFLRTCQQEFDIIVIDSTDPVGPGEGLFTADFYKSVAKALKPGGLMVAQSESPWYEANLLTRIQNNIAAGFKHKKPYVGPVPTYPRGLWSWTVASQSPLVAEEFDLERFESLASEFKFLSKDMMTSIFALPRFFEEKLR